MLGKPHILDLDETQIEHMVRAQGFEPYRARQVITWIYNKFAGSFEEMTDLPKELRSYLSENIVVNRLSLITLEKQKSDRSKRYLWGIHSISVAESVLLEYKYGSIACLSAQVGCPVRCVFCASGKLGFDRNLTRGEILDQFLGMCRESNERIGRIVFMGTGEPFFNYEAVIDAINMITRPTTYDMSRRKITVSTVGIPGAIREFAKDSDGVRLAVSLHAATDKVRNKLIPVSSVYRLEEVISAARYFADVTGQRITFEYMLLKDVNDSKEDAIHLAKLVSGIDCLINLIQWNPVPGVDFERSEPGKLREFKSILERSRIKVTVRRSLGGSIEGACGQLRRKST